MQTVSKHSKFMYVLQNHILISGIISFMLHTRKVRDFSSILSKNKNSNSVTFRLYRHCPSYLLFSSDLLWIIRAGFWKQSYLAVHQLRSTPEKQPKLFHINKNIQVAPQTIHKKKTLTFVVQNWSYLLWVNLTPLMLCHIVGGW